jgi:hypothetical protein
MQEFNRCLPVLTLNHPGNRETQVVLQSVGDLGVSLSELK